MAQLPQTLKKVLTLKKFFFGLISTGILLFPYFIFGEGSALDMVRSKKVAISVSGTRLYTDTAYTTATETKFNEGELFEIIGESVQEHFDNTQNQTFKWFRIRTVTGVVGWLFGDNVACIVPEYLTDVPLRPYYKRSVHFDNGFENAVIWVASTEGHDDKFKTQARLNPTYKEYYLVVTNAQGKSVSINYGNVSETGKRDIISFFLKDVTENSIEELILETQNFVNGNTMTQRQIEIYSFKAGGLTKIFEERLDLQNSFKEASPGISKFVEIDSSDIRISYVDFIDCNTYSVSNYATDVRTRTQEQCLEYVTQTLHFNKRSRNFSPLYPTSRAPVTAQIKSGVTISDSPLLSKKKVQYLPANTTVAVVKVYNDIVKSDGIKQLKCYFYVRTAENKYGYAPSEAFTILDNEHAGVLNQYFSFTPLNVYDFKPKEKFLRVH